MKGMLGSIAGLYFLMNKKKLLFLLDIKPRFLDSPAPNLVPIPTSLSRQKETRIRPTTVRATSNIKFH